MSASASASTESKGTHGTAGVHPFEDPAAFAPVVEAVWRTVLVAQIGIQVGVAVEDPHILDGRCLELLLGVRVLAGVVGVGPEVRPAAHAGGATALGVGHVEHAVRLGVQAGLVLFGVRDRIAQTAGGRCGHHVDAVEVEIVIIQIDSGAQDADEALAHLEQLLQGAEPDHRDQWTVGVAHLVLGIRGQLDERRRVTHALRLARIVVVDPSAGAAVVGAAVHVAGLRPSGEHDWAACLEYRA